MNAVLSAYFGYPYGQIWPNLLASLLCALAVWWRVHARMVAQHLEQMAQRERHHAELKEHVSSLLEGGDRM